MDAWAGAKWWLSFSTHKAILPSSRSACCTSLFITKCIIFVLSAWLQGIIPFMFAFYKENSQIISRYKQLIFVLRCKICFKGITLYPDPLEKKFMRLLYDSSKKHSTLVSRSAFSTLVLSTLLLVSDWTFKNFSVLEILNNLDGGISPFSLEDIFLFNKPFAAVAGPCS